MTLCRLFGLLLAAALAVVEGAAQLPPDIEADRYLVEAERHIRTGDHAAAQAALDRILALQAEHELALPEPFWFQSAQVAYQAGRYGAAVEAATRYLTTAGRAGAHYRAALALLDQATVAVAEQQAAAAIRRMPRTVRNRLGMEFVLIEPGTFAMGSARTEAGGSKTDNERPVHQVTLTQPFYLGKYEVTQGQWAAVMGSNPSSFSACGPTCPVDNVSWEDAQAFIAALNRQEGGDVYRLPTEAEWEYAARGRGRTGGYWCEGNSAGRPHPVGRKPPNGWGVYDMLGNVWEWTADRYGPYSAGPVIDPRGPSEGTWRAKRSGSWDSYARYCRATGRAGTVQGLRRSANGFRLARTP